MDLNAEVFFKFKVYYLHIILHFVFYPDPLPYLLIMCRIHFNVSSFELGISRT